MAEYSVIDRSPGYRIRVKSRSKTQLSITNPGALREATVPGTTTQLLADLRQGKPEAASKLMPLVYDELRRLARYYLQQERPNHTLQATALVHEAYLKLVGQERVDWQSRAHFLGVAAQMMRRILVDYARAHQTDKRGGREIEVSLEEALECFSPARSRELVALDEALTRLAEMSPRQSRIIELRFFGGLSLEETAEVLGIAPKTVRRDWSVARAWLHREVRKGKE